MCAAEWLDLGKMQAFTRHMDMLVSMQLVT